MRLEFGRYTTWEEGGRYHFQYIGGKGGRGKSRVIHTIKDMFRMKNGLHTLLSMGENAVRTVGIAL